MGKAPIAQGPVDVTVMPLLPCPFCGREPKSFGRPATEGEQTTLHKFVHFIACYCGGYSACAHKFGKGETPVAAEQYAISTWNKRHND